MNNRKRKKIINRLQAKLRGRRPINVTFKVLDLSSVVERPISRLSKVINDGKDALLGKIKKIRITRMRYGIQ